MRLSLLFTRSHDPPRPHIPHLCRVVVCDSAACFVQCLVECAIVAEDGLHHRRVVAVQRSHHLKVRKCRLREMVCGWACACLLTLCSNRTHAHTHTHVHSAKRTRQIARKQQHGEREREKEREREREREREKGGGVQQLTTVFVWLRSCILTLPDSATWVANLLVSSLRCPVRFSRSYMRRRSSTCSFSNTTWCRGNEVGKGEKRVGCE